MTFNSIVFLFSFLPICLILCYVVPKRFRNVPMLLCSLVFYAWGNPTYLLLMAFSVVFNYLTGLQLAAYQEEERHTGAKVSMICAVVVNLLVLGFFKYYGFLLSTINSLTGLHLSAPELPLPLGISFFTFSVLSYVLDVYRGKAEVQKNFLDFALFVTFFPKVISGPIVQYHDMAAQLKERSMSPAKFGAGISLFLVGLAKKVLLADNLVSTSPATPTWPLVWLSCLDLHGRRTLTTRIFPQESQNSGGAGISLWAHGSGNMSIFHWAAIAAPKSVSF